METIEYPGQTPVQVDYDVVITAGGTREQIDDVRYISNFSSGRLGHALAQEFTAFGRNVLLLSPDSTMQRLGEIEGVEHKSFTSCADLQTQLTSIDSARIVLQAAAVSDYTPLQSKGKISSDGEELIIRMHRNPKILGMLREHFGNHTYIVGFKLLSKVTSEDLLHSATQQIIKNRTDMCIANDLEDIGTTRTVYIRDKEHTLRASGTNQQVARHIASRVLLVANTRNGLQ